MQVFRQYLFLMPLAFSQHALANEVPTNLLNLRFEELFELEVEQSIQRSRWQFQYKYQQSRFEGYQDGTSNLSINDVLFTPGQDVRTQDNFPVVPTVIDQDVHALIFQFDATPQTNLYLSVPYVTQSSEHVSIVGGYPEFNIESSGIGDISLNVNHQLRKTPKGTWQISSGISFPTGSIDEEGDTPRAPGDQQLPYSMQVGSGTYDIPFSLSYLRSTDSGTIGVSFSAKWRIGENDRDYTLGDRYSVSAWYRWNFSGTVQPLIRLSHSYWGDIDGLDEELLVPTAFPFPAGVTNPNLYGGINTDLSLGLRIKLPQKRLYVELELGKPIYLDLNGPQNQQDYHFSITLGY
jgi:hypothetical protein